MLTDAVTLDPLANTLIFLSGKLEEMNWLAATACFRASFASRSATELVEQKAFIPVIIHMMVQELHRKPGENSMKSADQVKCRPGLTALASWEVSYGSCRYAQQHPSCHTTRLLHAHIQLLGEVCKKEAPRSSL